MLSLEGPIVNLDNLLEAYRKAKADVFFEKSQPFSLQFSRYESNLLDNLRTLASKLTSEKPTWPDELTFIGGFGYLPKGLKLTPKKRKGTATDFCHFSESDPELAWKLLREQNDVAAEFRAVAHFTVDMYVVCALWVNLVGHKFDRCLGPAARGSRLRRVGQQEVDAESFPYHETALGSFRPYFYAYRAWRKNGLDAIRNELTEGRRVIALTMDLASFYHRIDPAFLLEDGFLEQSGFLSLNGAMSNEEREFTEHVIRAFGTWGKQLPTWKKGQPVGVPVGPSAPRIIANVVLSELDQKIFQNLSPVYYGRYVDDLFLVLRDPGHLKSADDVLKFICDRIPVLKKSKSSLRLALPYAKGSRLEFKHEKQRIFMLSGDVGVDFLDTLESKINEVSSEWRLLPQLDQLEESPAARALTAARDSDVECDSLRKADSLSIKRLGLSILLRNLDALAQDLPEVEWRTQRARLYKFMLAHVITAERLLDLSEYIPRLLSMAVYCGDWEFVRTCLNSTIRVLDAIRESTATGKNEREWLGFKRHFAVALKEAMFRSVNKDSLPAEVYAILEAVIVIGGGLEEADLSHDLQRITSELRSHDLARIPIREMMVANKFPGVSGSTQLPAWEELPPSRFHDRLVEIKHFIKMADRPGWLLQPLLFPTRPPHPVDIGILVPSCVHDVELLQRFTRALRGVWVKVGNFSSPPDGADQYLDLGGPEFQEKPKICVTSFKVTDKSWNLAAAGTPDHSAKRYSRLMALANSILTAKSRPHYVLFPELSVPRRWMNRLVSRFLPVGISVVAGVEYERLNKNQVVNEAKLFLTDYRLGYRTYVAITQRKGIAAHAERDQLRGSFGLEFPPVDHSCTKWVYHHRGLDLLPEI